MSDLDVFLQCIAAPGVGAVYVPMSAVTDWLLANEKTLSFVQAEACGYGLRATTETLNKDGKDLHFLKIEKDTPWEPATTHPHRSRINTELSRSAKASPSM